MYVHTGLRSLSEMTEGRSLQAFTRGVPFGTKGNKTLREYQELGFNNLRCDVHVSVALAFTLMSFQNVFSGISSHTS